MQGGGAIAASLALHALLIAAAVWLLAPPPRPPEKAAIETLPVEVSERRDKALPPPTPPGEDLPAPAPAPSPAPSKPRNLNRQDAKGAKESGRPAALALSPVTLGVPGDLAVQKSGGAPEAAPPAAPASIPGSASAAGPKGPDADSIRQRIQGAIRYPRVARSQGLEGRATVRFHLDPSGNPSDLSIVTSSTHDILDTAATDAVRAAAPFPGQPAGWVRVPVDFSLRPQP